MGTEKKCTREFPQKGGRETEAFETRNFLYSRELSTEAAGELETGPGQKSKLP